jgi:hypothetical protein
MTDFVEVWLDADILDRTQVGTLSHDRGTLRFVHGPGQARFKPWEMRIRPKSVA